MIKLVVTDIDGTIANKNYQMSDNVINTIKNISKKGCKVVLATGRMYSSAKFIAEQLELNTPIIAYQGALIRETVEPFEDIFSSVLPEKIAKDIIKILKEKKFNVNVYENDMLYVEKDDLTIKNYANERNVQYNVLNDFSEIPLNGFNKILAIDNEHPEKVSELRDYLNSLYGDELYIVLSTPYFCEICKKDVSKGLAIELLAKKWNIKKEEILAIGDQDNDIEMLKSAGIKVAMCNGSKNVKEVADFVTLSVDDDGFSYAINKFVTGEKDV